MDMSDRYKFEREKKNSTNNLNHSSSNMPSDWRLASANPLNAPMGLIPTENPIVVSSSSLSSSPMIDSFGQILWHDPANVQNTGFSGLNVQNKAGCSNAMENRNTDPSSLRSSIDRPLDMIWSSPNLLPKGDGLFLPNVPGFLPHCSPQFPADSGFIERAARFSCFGGGSFSDMMNNPLGIPESLGLYLRGGEVMQGPQDIHAVSLSKSALVGQRPRNEMNVCDPLKDAEYGRFKNEGKSESLMRSCEEAKQNLPGSSNLSDEAHSSGGSGQNETEGEDDRRGETSSKVINSNKRKRMGQDSEPGQSNAAEQSCEGKDDNGDNKQKDEQNPNSATNQMSAGKQGRQAEPPKEGYIHVRARRGQATNSHSLAERVRREKISERMKFLQDLVPGCNKVTGKAVMLDEIINYVQSLQRQVEFLSMKLATVNPRLDFNIESLLAKEALHSRPGPSSALPFPQVMPMAYPALHPPQSGVIQPNLSGISIASNFLQRTINAQLPPVSGGFKQQEAHVWEGDLHNVVQMSYGAGAPPPDNQDVDESLPPGNPKVEP